MDLRLLHILQLCNFREVGGGGLRDRPKKEGEEKEKEDGRVIK